MTNQKMQEIKPLVVQALLKMLLHCYLNIASSLQGFWIFMRADTVLCMGSPRCRCGQG